MSGGSEAVFSRRIAILLGLVAAASFLGSIVFALLGDEVREEESHQTDTFSRSAIGHHALVSLLRQLEVPVVVSRFATTQRAGGGTALILLEPRVEADDPNGQDLPDMIRESQAGALVVVLPKWQAQGLPRAGGHVRQVQAVAHEADAVLRALGIEGARVRPATGGWQLHGAISVASPTLLRAPQVIEAVGIDPFITDETGGVLVGGVEALGQSVTLVADPDLLNNAGLLTGQNAELLLDLLARVAGERTLMIDETLHGFTVPEGVWDRLFRFPLVLATLQAGLVVALLLWAGMRRFGAPAPLAAALGRGRRVLVENTAHLLWFGGHSQDALTRYWAETLREVTERLHAPPRLGRPELMAWLDGVGRSRQVSETTGEIETAVNGTRGDGERILAVARRVHRWRVGMVQ